MTAPIDGYELSRQQETVWSFHRAGFRGYSQALLTIDGPVPPELLAEAVARLTRRHEVLRTRLTTVPGTAHHLQTVAEDLPPRWREADVSGLDADRLHERIAAVAARARAEAPGPDAGPPLHCVLLRESGTRHRLLLTAHPAHADRRSFAVLAAELAAALTGPAWTEEPLQYAQFVEWQRSLGGSRAEDPGLPPVGATAGAGWPEGMGDTDGTPEGVVTSQPDPALGARLLDYSSRHGVSPEAVLFGAFRVLLGRTAGVPASEAAALVPGRTHEDLAEAVGPFAVWAGAPALPGLEESFGGIVKSSQIWLDEEYREEAPGTRAGAASWDHAFEFHSGRPTTATAAGAVTLEWTEAVQEPHVLRLVARWDPDGAAAPLALAWHHDRRRLSEAYVARLTERFDTLLRHGLGESTVPSASLKVIGPRERLALIDDFQPPATLAGHTTGAPVHRIVEAHAEAAPDRVAVTAADRDLTYGNLNGLARRLAHRLRALGVGPETPVGIRMGHDAALPVAILGVLHAGGAYVPVDPAHPRGRAAELLSLTGCEVLLTTSDIGEIGFPGTVVPLDNLDALAAMPDPGDGTGERATADNLAYIMFTSGSSGSPKGVMVHHAALTNYLTWSAKTYLAGDESGSMVHSSIAFDLTVTSLLTPLAAGRTVRLLRDAQQDPLALARALGDTSSPTLVKLTPSHLRILGRARQEQGFAVKGTTLVVGGEALTADLLELWSDARIVNEYGPTEAVVGCCAHEAIPGGEPSAPVPIGTPVTGATLYVLDGEMAPVPVGAPGEVYIGGVSVARGYFEAPALTAERFAPDPYASEPGSRLYRTGDLACHLPQGGLRYLGRVDDQIKLRGFRIEPAEVEAVLRRDEAVRDAAVLLSGPDEPRELCAWLVPSGAGPVSADVVRSRAAALLPDHMVPSVVQWVAGIPLTPNGKVDRAALSGPKVPCDAGAGSGPLGGTPRDSVELRLLVLWEELLGRTGLGVGDDFFGVGGHSLLAVQLVARMETVFGARVPLATLFNEEGGATVTRLAAAVRAHGPVGLVEPVIRLSGRGDRPPMFFVHPAGGEILGYRSLARRIGTRRPVYAFQAPAGGDRRQSVSELAALYARRLFDAHPEGPYLLTGWSFGGVVAHEMVRLSASEGRPPSALILLDSYPAQPEVTEAELVQGFAEEVGRLFGTRLPVPAAASAGRPAAETVRRILEEAVGSGALPREQGLAAELSEQFVRHRAHIDAARAHVPGAAAWAGPVHLVQASHQDAAERREAVEAWRRVVNGPFTTDLAAGDHYSMLTEPHVGDLAALLEARALESGC